LHVAYMDLAVMTSDLESKVLTSLTNHLDTLGIPDDFPNFAG